MPEHVTRSHGAGGEDTQDLLKRYVLKALDTEKGEIPLSALDDSAVIEDVVFTTDSHTVTPLFFPGGDIGSLSVAGTINDISVMGARPVALSLALVLEEGLPFTDLERIMESIGKSSSSAGVPIVTGDTKVMEKGALDKIVLNTSGIGVRSEELDHNIEVVKEYRQTSERWVTDRALSDSDVLISSGYLGDHGIAILSFREGYGFETDVKSDVSPLNRMISGALNVGGIVSMKDPTRGGLANSLNEMSAKSGIGIVLEEENIPVREPVASACAMLGLDPLHIGNEGKAVIGVVKEKADDVLAFLKGTPEGKDAVIIGQASDAVNGVVMNTGVGGRRVVEAPIGDPVPRIC